MHRHYLRSDLWVYKCRYFQRYRIMLLGRVEPTHDGSLAKRQRVDSGPTVIGGKSPPKKIHASSGANRKAQHALSSETASSSSMITPTPLPSASEIAAKKAREQSRANIMQMRFRRALKTNDSRLMITCMESGYNPSLTQWLQIIGKAHVTTALRIIETCLLYTSPSPRD